MKKKILLIVTAIILLGAVLLIAFKLTAGKTQDEIITELRNELQLPEDDGTVISCVGEYELGDNALLWYYFENQSMTYYRAVECRVIADGMYRPEEIYKPMTYAQDIVHVIWRTDDVFLINNSDCRSVVYRDKSDNIIRETTIPESEIPYIFLHEPNGELTCDFLDAGGHPIP